MGNPFITFLKILLVALVFLIGAFIFTFTYNVLPVSPLTSGVKVIYNWIFGFFDLSFFFLIIILLLADLLASYFNPSILEGIGNILFLFVYGFLYVNTRDLIVKSVAIPLSFNTIMPTTYSTLENNYLGALIFFMLIMCAIMNFRHKASDSNEEF